MPVQNLISATIPAETKEDILQKLAEIRTKLDFLLTLQPDEIQGLFKAGNAYAPFIEKAYNVVKAYPQIMAGVFDHEEFKKDYELVKDLTIITNYVLELADALSNTLMAANSDAMANSLEVYAAVKQNCDRVPGLNVVSEEMAGFFKKSRKKGEKKQKP
jgi:uncharacterized protein YfkK (UPF0435 family)